VVYTLSVDIGGTFTDCVAINEADGSVITRKTLTSPHDLLVGVFEGLDQIADALNITTSDFLGSVGRFVHATTQSSNAIFSRTGAKTAVITTRGFADTLMIMRATGRVAGLSVFERHHYRNTDKPVPIVDERDIFELSERIDYKGLALVSPKESEVKEIAKMIKAAGYQAVAVCLLFSHKNHDHEDFVKKILRKELPDCFISLSYEVAPVMGEYERSTTTLFNAYVGELIKSYLFRLDKKLRKSGFNERLLVVQSNGGVATAAQTIPVLTIESGPAAGIVGAARVANQLGLTNVIATDVGGTTFKVGVISNGDWSYTKETVIDQYQLRLPMIDVASIGAGGGSIAWIDSGRLRIGPRSAAADPGPACYANGGIEPTVTDADVVLGYISPDRFLYGNMNLDYELAYNAINKNIAEPIFNGDVMAAAAGIRRVVDSQMADLIRKTTLERGYDTRDFVMMAYGGAGPTHVCSYGPEAGCKEIIIPTEATVHSAFGAAITDIRFSLSYSDPVVLPKPVETFENIYKDLEHQGRELLREAKVEIHDSAFHRWVEARYRRQVHTIRVSVMDKLEQSSIEAIAENFHKEYERLYGIGTGLKDAGIELINYGVEVIGHTKKTSPKEIVALEERPVPRLERPAYCNVQKKLVNTPVFEGAKLGEGSIIKGPAIIEQPGTTVVILTGDLGRVDKFGNLHLTKIKS
jgi:N-methylhydantoinase A